jgi:subtilase family serine protease
MGLRTTSLQAKPTTIGALLVLLAGCGGGSSAAGGAAAASAPAAASAQSVTIAVDSTAQVANFSTIEALPTFHVAPVILDVPADTDAVDPSASADIAPHTQTVPAAVSYLSTRRLTLQALTDAASGRVTIMDHQSSNEMATPMASGTQVATYSPAQIRAAYGLPALPTTGATPTAMQAAQMGAGQTIYIVDSNNDPNVGAELATFDQKFGLIGCVTTPISPTTKLPLAATPTTGCTLSLVYSTSTGAMTSTVPAYDSGWQTEIALDVQWSHATAPLARIILIEAPDASINSLLGAIALANTMGPGVVSMSFGGQEGSWTSSVDSYFTTSNMTYVAAAGDSGVGVEWPSVSPHVLAVGGTSLSYTAGSNRSETVWSGTGGAVSQYTPTPSYQASSVPGMGVLAHRAVSDVAFNADPATGQYIAIINPGSTSAGWLSAGGTSLSTPQWAGLLAIANAIRAQSAKPALGQPQALLYGQIASTPSTYASAFADITSGTDGSCNTCVAKVGYDTPTGLGTPNSAALLGLLTGSPASTNIAPVVASASITGTVGAPLSFAISVTAAHPVTFTLSSAPSGMTVNNSGIVNWGSPIAGSYPVTATARDSQTGLSGNGIYTVTISKPQPPVVNGATVKGTAGTALSFTVSITATHTVSYTLSGAPTGMTVSTAGVVSWASPVVGTYNVTAKATDTTTGLSGTGVYSVAIAAPLPPTVAPGSISGTAALSLSFSVSVSAPNAVSFALSGAPAGMTIAASGVISWPTPVAGTYPVTVIATDTKTNLTGKGVYTVTIAAAGPVIKVSPMSGVAGTPMSGTISITDSTANGFGVTISGFPNGMTFSASGTVITASWAKPVTGSYTMQIRVQDSNSKTASAGVPIAVTAH